MTSATSSISVLDLRRMLDFAGRKIIAQEDYLNSLDAALGDGDHGITMRLGCCAISNALGELNSAAELDVVLRRVGTAFMDATGGAIGVILGKMFIAGAGPLQGVQQFGTGEFKILLREMETSVIKTGKAKVGDKTILDAVHASNQAAAGAQEADLASLVAKAAQAAERAARDTAGMICRVGRASRLGARTLGCPDPGAVSFSIILRAMADWLTGTDS